MHQKGKIAIITGSTSGIGRIAAIELAKKGMKLVLPVRNIEKGERLLSDIAAATGQQDAVLMPCHLDSFDSIRQFVHDFRQVDGKLHLLINNAGVLETKRRLSKDGIELNFAVNYLSHFLLTTSLLDMIRESAPARIVNVSSIAHHAACMRLHDPEREKGWDCIRSYAQSKLAIILFTRKLDNMLRGSGVTVNCLHPGFVNTRLYDKMPSWLTRLLSPLMISPEKGAGTLVYLATSPEVEGIGGEYFVNKKIGRTSRQARNSEVAEKLWELSKTYCEST